MYQKYNKFIRLLSLLMLFLFMGIGNVWGAEVTETLTESEITTNITNTKCDYNTQKTYTDGTVDYTLYVNTDAVSRKWVQLKKDQGAYIKITAPGKITQVVATITSATNSKGGVNEIAMHAAYSGRVALLTADAAGAATMTGVAYTDGVTDNTITLSPSGNDTELYFKVSSGVRVWGISVTYETSSTDSDPAAPSVTLTVNAGESYDEDNAGETVTVNAGEKVTLHYTYENLAGDFLMCQWMYNYEEYKEAAEAVSGAPEEANTYTFITSASDAGVTYYFVKVMDDEGNEISSDFVTVIVKVAPQITKQPEENLYEQGDDASDLEVMASGYPEPTYQWYKNTTNSTEGATAIEGATDNKYKPSTTEAGTLYYYCIASNERGNATSNIVSIEVEEKTFNLTWKVEGVEEDFATTTQGNGTELMYPESTPEACSGWEFAGWTTKTEGELEATDVYTNTNDNKPTVSKDETYYAVFKKTKAGNASVNTAVATYQTSANKDKVVYANGGITLTIDKNTSSTDANNYSPTTTGKSYTSTRIYNGTKLTIAATASISKVVVTTTTEGYAKSLAELTWPTGVSATYNNTEVTISVTGSMNSITVISTNTIGFTNVSVTTSAITYARTCTNEPSIVLINNEIALATVKKGETSSSENLTVTCQYLTAAPIYTLSKEEASPFTVTPTGEFTAAGGTLSIALKSTETRGEYSDNLVITYGTGDDAITQTVALTAKVIEPKITTSYEDGDFAFGEVARGYGKYNVLTVTTQDLTAPVVITLAYEGEEVFTIEDDDDNELNSLPIEGGEMIVYFTSAAAGEFSATLALSSEGAESVSIPLSANVKNVESAACVIATAALTDNQYLTAAMGKATLVKDGDGNAKIDNPNDVFAIAYDAEENAYTIKNGEKYLNSSLALSTTATYWDIVPSKKTEGAYNVYVYDGKIYKGTYLEYYDEQFKTYSLTSGNQPNNDIYDFVFLPYIVNKYSITAGTLANCSFEAVNDIVKGDEQTIAFNVSDGYSLQKKDFNVTVDGTATDEFTWNADEKTLTITVTGNVVISASAVETSSYSLSWNNLEGVTVTGTTAFTSRDGNLTLTYEGVPEHYTLSVTGAEVTVAESTITIAKPASGWTGDVSLTLSLVEDACNMITWKVGEEASEPVKVYAGEAIGTLPAKPAVPASCGDKVFVGWTADETIVEGTAPSFINAETVPTTTVTYKAVFADVTIGDDVPAYSVLTVQQSPAPSNPWTAEDGTVWGWDNVTFENSANACINKNNGSVTITLPEGAKGKSITITGTTNQWAGTASVAVSAGGNSAGSISGLANSNDSKTLNFETDNQVRAYKLTNSTDKNAWTKQIRIDYVIPGIAYANYVFSCEEPVADLTVAENNVETIVEEATYTNVTVQPDGVLNVNANLTVTGDLTLQANGANKPEMLVNGNVTANHIYYEWTIAKGKGYAFAMPCEVAYDKITYKAADNTWSGEFDMFLTEYNGAARAQYGAEGATGKGNYYYTTDGAIQANKGYILRVDGIGDITIRFELDKAMLQNGESNDKDVEVAANNGNNEEDAGWNLIGNPYLSSSNANITLVSVLAVDAKSYKQGFASENKVSPFAPVFVQVTSESVVGFNKGGSSMSAIRAQERVNQEVIFTEITLSGDAQDHTGLFLGEQFTTAYDRGNDLVKMYGEAQTTLIYTVQGNTRLAYNALPDEAAQAIPVGFSVPAEGTYTIAIDQNRMDGLDHLYLIDHVMNTVTDLLSSDYDFIVTGQEINNEARFELNAVRANTTTEIISNEVFEEAGVQKLVMDGKVYIIRNGVWYNAMGQMVK